MRYRYVLEFIDRYIRENGISPTIREIKEGLELSSTSITRARVLELAEDELISFKPSLARTIQITERGRDAIT